MCVRRKCGTSETDVSSQSEEMCASLSRELETSTMSMWRVLRKRMEMKPNRLHLVQFLQSFWYKMYNSLH
jgi:hypothetical protein